jgi:hypothetical protein
MWSFLYYSGHFLLLWAFRISLWAFFVFVKFDLSIRSGNNGMGIFVFVKFDLIIRSGNSCMGNFVL